ncbi:MAG: HAMP domain-containing histidine kinase [Clostridiaceae bacterium]|nr:HAMP domain-containing histidine kinase [Clostridiaceae bacterium]
MDKLKLKWKIFIFLLGFCVLLLAILWIFQTVFLSDMYKFVRKMEIEKAIQTVEKNINNPELGNILLELEASKAITVRPTQEFYPPSLPAPGRHKNGPETITSVREFVLEDGKKISLTFHAMITPVDSTVSTLQIRLVIITGMMVLLATMLAILIAKHTSKPIEKINQSAKALAKGNYDTEFRGKGYLEIKELSDTLNTAATELSKTERLRRELIANVSHDLRTPLALIYSYAEMMHDFPDEVTPDQSQIIMDETKRLTSLVNDMPDISLLEAGVSKLNKMSYNLTESLKRTVNRMNELVKHEGYRLEFEAFEDVAVVADEVKITQVLYNLLLNAITHSGEDKTVLVRQRTNDKNVRIEVIDKGEGIRKSDLPYIRDRYYKVDKNHKRPIMGTGLGLSIVKKIIEMHDGTYGVETEEGKGSLFWFEIQIEQ